MSDRLLVRLPITIESLRRTKINYGYPYILFKDKRISDFTDRYGGNYIILSLKYGLMFSNLRYNQYSNSCLSENDFLNEIKEQVIRFPFLDLYFYNPNCSSKTRKYINLLQDLGFKVKEFIHLNDFDLEPYIHYNELENYCLLERAFKEVPKIKRNRSKKKFTLDSYF